MASFFSEIGGGFFFDPMLSHKTIATNSLKQNFLQDVWFGRDADYFNTQTTPIDSNSSIDRLRVHIKL